MDNILLHLYNEKLPSIFRIFRIFLGHTLNTRQDRIAVSARGNDLPQLIIVLADSRQMHTSVFKIIYAGD